jgi:hypothetical protein
MLHIPGMALDLVLKILDLPNIHCHFMGEMMTNHGDIGWFILPKSSDEPKCFWVRYLGIFYIHFSGTHI